MIGSSNLDDDEAQGAAWEALYELIQDVLQRFGEEDYLGRADYWIRDDNWGPPEHRILINKLSMLQPQVIETLQKLLVGFPEWEIIVIVDVPGKGWPPMGLTLRHDGVIEHLKREHLSPEYRHMMFTGNRP